MLLRTLMEVKGRSLHAAIELPPSRRVVGTLMIVPTVGIEGEDSFRSLILLARRAADAGFAAMVLDLSGMGDSLPLDQSHEPVATWREDVVCAAHQLSSLCPEVPLSVLGCGLGAAIVAGTAEPLLTNTLWWRPTSGKTWLRRARLLALAGEAPSGSLLGLQLTAAQREFVSAMPAPPSSTLSFEPQDSLENGAANPGGTAPSTYGSYGQRVPGRAADLIVAALPTAPHDLAVDDSGIVRQLVLQTESGPIQQDLLEVGPHGLAAIRVAGTPETSTVVLFTAQGPERSAGPGAMWTEASWSLAKSGVASIRCERRRLGVHSEPGQETDPNPYTDDAVDDVAHFIQHGRGIGATTVLVGSCAGGWLAVKASKRSSVDRVIAINVLSWASSVGSFERIVIDPLEGQSALESVAPALARSRRPVASAKQRLRTSPIGPALQRLSWAARSKSLAVPLLWRLPRGTKFSLVLSPLETDLFRGGGGRIRLGVTRNSRVSVIEAPVELDHSLRHPFSRGFLVPLIRKIAQEA